MYRPVNSCSNDIQEIVAIYNETTGRKRTVDEHYWEWFLSPYNNRAYVITKKDDSIIGHHGILSIEFNYGNRSFKVGKTENTVVKKGFGAAYPKNEIAMFKEYSKEYDLLITTAAFGVTKRIREKLGYVEFARYVVFFSVLDSSFFTDKFTNKLMKSVINLTSKLINPFLPKGGFKESYSYFFSVLEEEHLEQIVSFYDLIKKEIKFSQNRTVEFLRYRLLNNPYSSFRFLKVHQEGRVIGLCVYQVHNKKLTIEDILSTDKMDLSIVLNGLISHAKKNNLAKIILFSTLENSLLDRTYKGFFRKKLNKNAPCIVVNKICKSAMINALTVESMYFTRLSNEGIINK